MNNISIKKLSAVVALMMACGLSANAVPTMRLSADGGATWTVVTDNGPLDSNPAVGSVTYAGPVGDWAVSIASGIGSPLVGDALNPLMDVSTLDVSSNADTLIVQMSDTGFTPFANQTFIASMTVTTTGTVSYNTYRDTGNVLFGTTGVNPSPTASLLMAEGPFTGGTFQPSNSVVVANGGTTPYSLTLETVIVHAGPAQTQSDASLYTLPPPACTGQIGDFVWSDTNSNGCQDAGEPGISGVEVDLYSGCGVTGTPIAITNTDNTGHYLFSGLCAGTYTVSFVSPSGYVRTMANAGCTNPSLPPDQNQLDSKCDCSVGSPCGICVTLTSGNPINLNVDCGYVFSNPSLQLEKTAVPTTAVLGQPVTYYYAITNTGGVTVSNINIVDDNGTPSDPSDDYLVNAAPFSLVPGQGELFAIPHISEPVCMSYGGTNLYLGALTVNVLINGDVEVYFVQPQSLNDNRYGTGATSATGWSGGHKYSDLTGSDQADFQFTDGTGKVVLDFLADYISAATSTKFGDGVAITYPSGYGTLGALGGDGKMNTGSSSNILSVHTSLSDTINQAPAFYGFTVNSPPETSPLSNVSIPAGWNYTDSYYVKISHNAFGANGFGGVTIPFLHDSPSKIQGIIKFMPTNVCSCVVNTAQASAHSGSIVIASSSDSASVCFPPAGGGTGGGGSGGCNITSGKLAFGPPGAQLPVQNNGSSTVFMTELDLSWPQSANGNLVQVTLNGPAAVWKGSASSPITLTSADFDATSSNTTQRSLPTGPVGPGGPGPGPKMNITMQFKNPVNKTVSSYSGTVKFGTNSTCIITFP